MENAKLKVECDLGHLHLCCAYRCEAQTKKMLDVGKKLDADTHVFWGGREGFATALNTKVPVIFSVNSDVMMWAVSVLFRFTAGGFLGRWDLCFVTGQERTWPHGHLSQDGRGLQKEDRIQGAIHHWAQSSWANCASIRLRCPNGHWFLVSVGALEIWCDVIQILSIVLTCHLSAMSRTRASRRRKFQQVKASQAKTIYIDGQTLRTSFGKRNKFTRVEMF